MNERVACFGLAVQMRRKKLKLSQVELADRAELSPSFVSRVERGVMPPSLDAICALADALRTNPSSLLLDMEGLVKMNAG